MAAAWSLKKSAPDADTISLQIVDAEIKIRQGRYEDAEKILRDAQDNARKYKKVIESIEIVRRMAEVGFRMGKTEAAEKALTTALKLARTCGPENFLIRAWEKEEWVTEFLKQQANRSGRLKIYEPLRLPVLDARFFGAPKVAWNGRLIGERSWPTAKSKKTLFFLLYRYPENIDADQLLEALWPGSSRTAGQNSLRKALQHIRQAFASCGADPDSIIVDKGTVGIASQVIVRRDIDQMKILETKDPIRSKRGRTWRSSRERSQALSAVGIADGWFDNWLDDLRAVHNKWRVSGLRQLADHYWKSKKYPAAAGCYKKLIGIDPYEESYYRALMVIAAKKRDLREVKRLYARLTVWLKTELSARPQAATTNLYQELVSQPT
jgi:DNA-binding SARP family transcriptional activator